MQEFVVPNWKAEGPLAILERRGRENPGYVPRCYHFRLPPWSAGPGEDSGNGLPDAGCEAHGLGNEAGLDPNDLIVLDPAESFLVDAGGGGPQPELPVAAAATQEAQRTFVVSHGEQFVGVFTVEKDVTPREAFSLVAQELTLIDEDIDPHQIHLYKPVLMRSAKPRKCDRVVQGHFQPFKESRVAAQSAGPP